MRNEAVERLEAEITRLQGRAAEMEQRLAESQCALESARCDLAEYRRRSWDPLKAILATEVRLLDAALALRNSKKEASDDGK